MSEKPKQRKPRTRNKNIKPFIPTMTSALVDQELVPVHNEVVRKITEPIATMEPTVYANGRKAALECLDALLFNQHNIQKLHESLQDRFDTNPANFFQELVIPLTPKESLIKMAGDADNKAPIRIIMAAEAPPEPTMPPVAEQSKQLSPS